MVSPLRSLPRLCVALGERTPEALARSAEREYKDGNTFLEFRLDALNIPEGGISIIELLTRRYSDLRIIATCRGAVAGGSFAGDATAQLQLLNDAAKSGAAILDLEIEVAERNHSAAIKLRRHAALIVSFHDFRKTPALPNVVRRLERVKADAYKLVTTARKCSDDRRLLALAREGMPSGTPLIAFAMAETGVVTRVLSPALGCLYTYAAPTEGAGTAEGQVTAGLMRKLYRCERLSRKTRVYGVIADPVSHSKSPLIHNRGFQARRVDAVYLPFLVGARDLQGWMELAESVPVTGFSVTIPHKQRILRYLDAVDPLAKRIGAVNTVWRKGGKWRGTNTDVDGILTPLKRRMPIAKSQVLIAGYGGAARAAAFALHDAGAHITLTGRNLAGARKLAAACHGVAVSLEEAGSEEFDVLLNATPVGMAPDPSASLFHHKIPAHLVFDMVYQPHETALLRMAKSEGCQVIYGTEMLLEQALRQFEIWTGEGAPRATMQDALDSALHV